MTANFRQFECAVCHDPIQYGQYLPFAHTNGRPQNARAHYARPASSRATEVETALPPAAREELLSPGSRPDVAATSHSASRTG